MSDKPKDRPEPPRSEPDTKELRQDIDEGLRFVNVMAMQTKYDLLDTGAQVSALVEELTERGVLDPDSFERRVDRLRHSGRERMLGLATVRISAEEDKYALSELPEIDCAARIPLCKARCCTFEFPLSFQDLDEGVVKFDYASPYVIRKHPGSSYCSHCDPATRGCTVYEHRPAVCRTYDCRNDKRIWRDFERRIPADPDSDSEP